MEIVRQFVLPFKLTVYLFRSGTNCVKQMVSKLKINNDCEMTAS